MKIIIGLIIGMTISAGATAKETEKDACFKILGAGMYNGILEDICGFNGGVKEKIKTIYAAGKCPSLINPEEINQLSEEILIDTKNRFQELGETKFCDGNKQAYYDLANESDNKDSSEDKKTTSTTNLPIKIKQEMSYLKARKILINNGWQTVAMHTTPNGTPTCWADYEGASEKDSCKYEEIDSCSGSGMGFCNMYFFDGDKTYLRIITAGGEPPDAQIDSWEKTETPPSINSN